MPIIAIGGRGRSGKDTTGQFIRDALGDDRVKLIAFAGPIKQVCREVFDWTDEHVNGGLKGEPDLRYPRTCTSWTPWRTNRHECTHCGKVIDATVLELAPGRHGVRWHECTHCGKVIDATSVARTGWSPEPAPCSHLTPREAMQTLGTEWGRACYEDVWAALGVRRALGWVVKGDSIEKRRLRRRLQEAGDRRDAWECNRVETRLADMDALPRVAVITDCRFTNEARLVREAGGEVWFLERDAGDLEGGIAGHPSEEEMKGPEYQDLVSRRFNNDGTLDDLRASVLEALRC
jgi:hypothetical protein